MIYYKVKDFITNIKTFFRNLIKFRKDLWNFRAFDFNIYNLSILKTSINLTKNYLKKFGHEADVDRLVRIEELERASEILENITKHKYLSMAEKELGFKYNTDNFMDEAKNDDNNYSENNFKLSIRRESIREKEWKELWETIKEKSYGWWD